MSLSRLRVQRYADFSIPPNIPEGFLRKLAKKVVFGQENAKMGDEGGERGEKRGREEENRRKEGNRSSLSLLSSFFSFLVFFMVLISAN